jgi:hypothetical protein
LALAIRHGASPPFPKTSWDRQDQRRNDEPCCQVLLRWHRQVSQWEVDPVLLPFRDLPPFGRLPGYAGPPNRKAAEVVTKYIVTDMYAKAIQGMPAEDAVKWAHDEVVKAYA